MRPKPRLPAKERKVLEQLSGYVGVLRYDWATYLALYTHPSSVETLQRAAAPFFASLEDRLRDGVLLSLARLFDPVTNPKQDNLTLISTVHMLREFADPEFVNRVTERIEQARVQAEPIREERHKRIAHLDTTLLLGPKKHGGVSHEQIELLLVEVEAIVDMIDLELRGERTLRPFYTNLAHHHVAQLVGKLAVVAAMSDDELTDRMVQLRDHSTAIALQEEGTDRQENYS